MKDPDTEMTPEERADLFDRLHRFWLGDDAAATDEEVQWLARNQQHIVIKPL